MTDRERTCEDPRSRRAWLRASARVAFAFVLLLFAVPIVQAVTVTPAAVYIDHRTRSGTLTLYNTGELPEEIEISFAFGYPVSDENGSVGVALMDDPAADEPSAVSWMRAFPRRLVIPPGERQVVRIVGEPPANLPDGEYWARALVSSQGGQPPIEEIRGNMRVAVALETVIVTAVTYRKGAVSTGVEVEGATAIARDSAVSLLLDLKRTGNAAFIGRVLGELVAADGTVLARTEDYMAVYHSLRLRVDAPYANASSLGGATFRFVVDTERSDLPPGGPLPAREIRGTVPVQRAQ